MRPLPEKLPTAGDVRAAIQAAPTVDVPSVSLERGANALLVSNLNQLIDVLGVVYEVGTGFGFAYTDKMKIEDLGHVMHEGEHAAAAKSIGIDVRFGVCFTWVENGGRRQLAHQVFMRCDNEMSLLELAAITAAPTSLSPGDLADLEAMGFSDVEHVAREIFMHNKNAQSGDKQLPMPKSAALTRTIESSRQAPQTEMEMA